MYYISNCLRQNWFEKRRRPFVERKIQFATSYSWLDCLSRFYFIFKSMHNKICNEKQRNDWFGFLNRLRLPYSLYYVENEYTSTSAFISFLQRKRLHVFAGRKRQEKNISFDLTFRLSAVSDEIHLRPTEAENYSLSGAVTINFTYFPGQSIYFPSSEITQLNCNMATAGGWTIIPPEEKHNSVDTGKKRNPDVPCISDYYEVVGEYERKCRLCFTTIKIAPTTGWNMKVHFKRKHANEWSTQFEPFLRPTKSKVRLIFNWIKWLWSLQFCFEFFLPQKANEKMFELISSEVPENPGSDASVHSDCETMEPNTINSASLVKTEVSDFNSPASAKLTKFYQSFVDDSLGHSRSWNSSPNGIATASGSGTMCRNSTADPDKVARRMTNGDDCSPVCIKNCLTKDEFIIFGNFIATELRNLKTEQFRRKLKLIFQKSLLEVMEEEETMLAKRDKW